MLQDLKFAWRRIRRAPGPSVFAVLTLVVGIGVTVATYSVVFTMWWRPMGIADESRILLVSRTNLVRPGPDTLTMPDFLAVQRGAAALGVTHAAAWSSVPVNSALVGRGRGELAAAEFVTGDYFPLLGIRPALGRLLSADDDRPGAAPVAVLSDAAWRTQFASDRAVVGQSITIANRPFVVVGVTAEGFRGVHQQGVTYLSAWAPLASWPAVAAALGRRPQPPDLTVGVRMAADVAFGDVAAALDRLGVTLDRSAPRPPVVIRGAPPVPRLRHWAAGAITDDASIDIGSELGRLVVALPGLVLLIACTNIASLTLSRGASRRQEFGIRRALGASRWQLIREQVVEQGAIAAVGGGAAILLARKLLEAASTFVQTTLGPFFNGAPIDWHFSQGILPATAMAVLVSTVVAGVIPSLHLTRDSLRAVLAHGDAASTPRWRGRGNLIALQLGVSAGLVLIAIVFGKMTLTSLGGPSRVSPATASAPRLALAGVPLRMQGRDEDFIRAYADRVVSTARQTAGVEGAAVTSNAALLGTTRWLLARFVGRAAIPGAGPGPGRPRGTPDRPVDFAAVSGDYFGVTGATLVKGRLFDAHDATSAVVSEGLALALFQTTDVVGRTLPVRIDEGGPAPGPVVTMTIAGVVRPIENGPAPQRRAEQLFLPFEQYPSSDVTFVARGSANDRVPVAALADALRSTDATVAVAYVASGDVLARGPIAFAGAIATTLACLAALALTLATVGLYGVLGHVVAGRTREIGIRVALGASTRAVLTLVLRDGLRPVAEGLFIGLATATVIRWFMQRTMTGDVAVVAPWEYGGCALLLATAGVAACWSPARRAARVAPNVALRSL